MNSIRNNPAIGRSWNEVRNELYTPEEIAASDLRVSEIEKDYYLMIEAHERLNNNIGKDTLSLDSVMQSCGITQADIENAEDLDIE